MSVLPRTAKKWKLNNPRPWARWLFALSFLMGFLASAEVEWNSEARTLAVDVRDVTLSEALQQVADATDWEVYVEPGLTGRVDVSFSAKPVVDALRAFGFASNYSFITRDSASDSLYLFRRTRSDATERVGSADASEADGLDDESESEGLAELLVTIDPESGISIEELAASLGARVIGKVEGLNTYRLAFDDPASADAALERLRTEDGVSSVETNQIIRAPSPAPRPVSGGLPPIRLRPQDRSETEGILIGLVDSTVTPSGTELDKFLAPQRSVAADLDSLEIGGLTHGTTMFETILRGMELALEPGETSVAVQILPIDIYGGSDQTTIFHVANGIVEAVNAGATVINLSFGGAQPSPLVQDIISDSQEFGVSFFAAAGNEPVATEMYPAAYPDVVAVTAMDPKGDIANYANRGDFVDVAAPGSNVITFGGQNFYTNGTSVSAAYVSGMAASRAAQSNLAIPDVEIDIRERLRFDRKSDAGD